MPIFKVRDGAKYAPHAPFGIVVRSSNIAVKKKVKGI
jgi:hypothetical protein